MDDNDAIIKFLLEVRANIIRLQAEKGLKASGQSALSLRVEGKQEEGELWGLEYFIQQEEGRKPGQLGDVKGLYDWLQYRKYGLSYASDKARWSIAWAIARKQAMQGSYTHRHGPTGVLSEAVSDELVDRFTASVAISKIDGMLVELKQALV